MSTKRTWWLVATALALGGCAPSVDVAVNEAEIVGGTVETGYPSVMLLYNRSGGLCTATLISPRVVLTARHCVTYAGGGSVAPASSIYLYVGTSERSLTAEYRAARIHTIPGSTGAIGDGRAQDVALVELAAAAAQEPMSIARTSPAALVGTEITAIGYGQTPSSSGGTKYRTTARVDAYQQGLVFVEPAVCQGDSGGPLIGADGLVYGVASFIFSPDGRTEPRCGTAPGAYNEIYRHLEWIDGVLESVGDACIADPEVCDGLDNDCDEVVDDGCDPLGAPCTDSARCVGNLCAETIAGTICTQECDPMRPGLGCPPGFYCSASGCLGRCVPIPEGATTSTPVGAACEHDTDCATLRCADPGDGRRRCVQPCRLDAGLCLAGEVCVPIGGECGACVEQDIVYGLGRGLGEACSQDTDCRSGACRDTDGQRECVAPCGEAGACPELFRCEEGFCVRDRRQGVGGPCEDNADCACVDGDCGGLVACAFAGERSWCTAVCDDASDCPASFECRDVGGASYCVPTLGLPGEPCESAADCTTGICARDGDEWRCSAFCDADDACGPGFDCRRTEDGTTAICMLRRPPSGGGGCSVSRRAGSAWLLAAAALLALAVRRRRRQRAPAPRFSHGASPRNPSKSSGSSLRRITTRAPIRTSCT